jgi:hypothetical protein
MTVHLQQTHPLDNCWAVFVDGDDFGDIEQLADGTWIGDVTSGNGPPSRPFATRDEAVAYVTGGRV